MSEAKHRAPAAHPRTVRSYVVRGGRLTPGQRRGLEQHRDYLLEITAGRADWRKIFGRAAPVVLEIGFGMGDSLCRMMAAEPDKNFVGVEVHPPGVGRLLNNAAAAELRNLRVYLGDAVAVLDHCIPPQTISRVQLYFPDPWHKKKHHKRRLVQPDFVAKVRRVLAPDGILHMATDWLPYAEHMAAVMGAAEGFENTVSHGTYAPRPEFRPVTKFEQRGQRLGHGVWDLLYRRVN